MGRLSCLCLLVCSGIPAVCGATLSAGALVGIHVGGTIFIILIVFGIIGFCIARGYWNTRHNYNWSNPLTSCCHSDAEASSSHPNNVTITTPSTETNFRSRPHPNSGPTSNPPQSRANRRASADDGTPHGGTHATTTSRPSNPRARRASADGITAFGDTYSARSGATQGQRFRAAEFDWNAFTGAREGVAHYSSTGVAWNIGFATQTMVFTTSTTTDSHSSAFGPRHGSSFETSQYPEDEESHKPDSEFTEAPPPSYATSSAYAAPDSSDLPPPYPGPPMDSPGGP